MIKRKKLSERMSELAASKMINYARLEREAGIYRKNVKKIESGKSSPTLNTLFVIAGHFNLRSLVFYNAHTGEIFNKYLSETGSADGLEKYVSHVFSEERERQQLSVSDVAKKVKMDRSNYKRYEKCTISPSPQIIDRISEVLGIVPMYLSKYEEEKHEKEITEKDTLHSRNT